MRTRAIYITSTEVYSGKSIVAVALALLAKQQGKKVGYFKPIGLEFRVNKKGHPFDEDTKTMKHILGIKKQATPICSLLLRKDRLLEDFSEVDTKKLAEDISLCYTKASKGKDLMLIEGPSSLSIGSFFGCPVPKLASEFGARIILVVRFKDDLIVDEVLQSKDYCLKWGVSIDSVILNRVPHEMLKRARTLVVPALKQNGISVLGIVPEDKILSSLTVREIHEVVGGKVLAGREGLDRTIQTVLIGAMTPDSAIKYFQKAENEIVITGGDRTEIIFTALEAGASALILTGNIFPSVKIFPRADEMKIPIILVPNDTYSTLRKIQSIVGRVKAVDDKRIERSKKLIESNVDWDQILNNQSFLD